MAKADLGTKRVCPETGKKFYDLNKDPIVSPFTGNEYPLSFFEEAAVTTPSKKAPKPEAKAEKEPEAEAQEVADGFEDETDDTPEVDVAAEQLPDDDDDDDDDEKGSGLSDDIADDFEDENLDEDDEDDNTTVLIDDEEDEDFGDFNIAKEDDL